MAKVRCIRIYWPYFTKALRALEHYIYEEGNILSSYIFTFSFLRKAEIFCWITTYINIRLFSYFSSALRTVASIKIETVLILFVIIGRNKDKHCSTL